MFRAILSRRGAAVAVIIGCAFGAVYASLVLYQRIDGELFPGNELVLPSVPAFVPGTHVGVDVSLPGVASAVAKPWTPASRLNILVLGLDRRPGEPEDTPSRSDTMFIASIDKAEGRLQMLAIPRDLWSEIPYGNKPGDWAQAKINAAYSYGQFYKYPGGGAAAAVAAVQHDFNITIDHYVVIDWVGFVQLIDAIGGIDLDVPVEVSDFGTDTLDMYRNNTISAGLQHMDGQQALGYSRVRVDGDLKRIERQQLVIKAVAGRSVSFGYVAKIPELWDAYRQALRTDIDNALIPGFALLARQLNLDAIETFTLGPATYPGIAEDGQLILLPNKDEVYAIIDRFFADPKLRDEQPVIAIAYSAGKDADAKAARAHLEAYGVPPAFITLLKAPPSATPGTAGIFDLSGKPYTASKLAGLFNLRLLNPDSGAPDGVDVLVRLGDSLELKKP